MYNIPDCSNVPNKCNTKDNEDCVKIIDYWSHLADIILALFMD